MRGRSPGRTRNTIAPTGLVDGNFFALRFFVFVYVSHKNQKHRQWSNSNLILLLNQIDASAAALAPWICDRRCRERAACREHPIRPRQRPRSPDARVSRSRNRTHALSMALSQSLDRNRIPQHKGRSTPGTALGMYPTLHTFAHQIGIGLLPARSPSSSMHRPCPTFWPISHSMPPVTRRESSPPARFAAKGGGPPSYCVLSSRRRQRCSGPVLQRRRLRPSPLSLMCPSSRRPPGCATSGCPSP